MDVVIDEETTSAKPETFWKPLALGLGAAFVALATYHIISIVSTEEGLQPPETPPQVNLSPIKVSKLDFKTISSWPTAAPHEAILPFQLSCEALMRKSNGEAANPLEKIDGFSLSGKVEDWQPACNVALTTEGLSTNASAAQEFFETHFTPIRIYQPQEEEGAAPSYTETGLFTGYYEPIYEGSPEFSEKFSVPALTKPEDLISVDLGAFRDDLKGKKIAGRIDGKTLIPYADHQEIITTPVSDPLLWMDPNDLLFLQIQGSGKINVNGEIRRIGYAAQNGHSYTPIGRTLVRSGEIPLEQISMQTIRQWLETADAQAAAEVRYSNASYVFFQSIDDLKRPELGPLGAQGVQLVSGRSLAVDRRYHAMGAPILLKIEELGAGLAGEAKSFSHKLMIAQDTGGAIKGAVRGDVFVGSGPEAGDIAGVMKQAGEMIVFLPNAVAQRLLTEGQV